MSMMPINMKRKAALTLAINFDQDKMKQPLQFKLTINDDRMIEIMVKRSIMWSQGSHGVKEMDHIAKGRESIMPRLQTTWLKPQAPNLKFFGPIYSDVIFFK